jgi:hypothetical protein
VLFVAAPGIGDGAIPLRDERGRTRQQVGAYLVALDAEPDQLDHVGKVFRAG